MVKLLLFKGNSLISGAIKWFSRSEYCHAELQIGSKIYVASEKGPVSLYSLFELDIFHPKDEFDVFEPVTPFTLKQEKLIEDFATKQLGKKYDWRMVFDFFMRLQNKESRKSSQKWFCSEYCFAALAQVQPPLNTKAWLVKPHDLSISPLWKKVDKGR